MWCLCTVNNYFWSLFLWFLENKKWYASTTTDDRQRHFKFLKNKAKSKRSMETSTKLDKKMLLTKPGGSLAMSNDGKRLDQFYQSRSFFHSCQMMEENKEIQYSLFSATFSGYFLSNFCQYWRKKLLVSSYSHKHN